MPLKKNTPRVRRSRHEKTNGEAADGNTAVGNTAVGNTAVGNTAVGNTAVGNTAVDSTPEAIGGVKPVKPVETNQTGRNRFQAEGSMIDTDADTETLLPSLPRPTKPMTVDEYAKYLQAEMQLEDVVLERAAAIKANLARLKLPAAPEPKRAKTHWDNVLLEMVWLAKEFQRERRWKLNTAKRVASTAQRSNMDLESRVVIKEQEEEKAKKKLAAWISKEVMQGFWNKAHKVVAFKVKNEVDARKKEVLDRQMDVWGFW
jgi:hypothetical protein